jgi:hypothetical protein
MLVSRHLAARTGENKGKLQTGQPVCWADIQTWYTQHTERKCYPLGCDIRSVQKFPTNICGITADDDDDHNNNNNADLDSRAV